TAVGGLGAVIGGTPPTPATLTAIVWLGPSDALGARMPRRVSRMREGVSAVYWLPPAVDVVDVNHPPTSTMTLTLPYPLKMLTRPFPSSGVMTRLGMTWLATKFRFDASGCEPGGEGDTVRKPSDVGFATVTLSTTASTPVAGTGPLPLTCTCRVWPGPSGAGWLCPTASGPLRVSSRRVGTTGL